MAIPDLVEPDLARLLATELPSPPPEPGNRATEAELREWVRGYQAWVANVHLPRRRELAADLLRLEQELVERDGPGVSLARALLHEELLALDCADARCLDGERGDLHRAEALRHYGACRAAAGTSALSDACARRARTIELPDYVPECAVARGPIPAEFVPPDTTAPRYDGPLLLRVEVDSQMLVFEAERQALEAQVAAEVERDAGRPVELAPNDDREWPAQCQWVQRSSPPELVRVFLSGESVASVQLDVELIWLDAEEQERRGRDHPLVEFSILDPTTWAAAIEQQVRAPPVFVGGHALAAGTDVHGWPTFLDGPPVAPSSIEAELDVLREACGVTPDIPLQLVLGFDAHGRLTRGEARRGTLYSPSIVRCVNHALEVRASERTSTAREVSRVGVESYPSLSPTTLPSSFGGRTVLGRLLPSPGVSAAISACEEEQRDIEVCAHVRSDGSIGEIDVSRERHSAPRVLTAPTPPRPELVRLPACIRAASRDSPMPCTLDGGMFIVGASR
ncbi:MAG: hypothetical protein IPL19_09735 [Sandaracinaceae bacterium]|nr:hypothetical protein [Sandaracinaceae bacterium]